MHVQCMCSINTKINVEEGNDNNLVSLKVELKVLYTNKLNRNARFPRNIPLLAVPLGSCYNMGVDQGRAHACQR